MSNNPDLQRAEKASDHRRSRGHPSAGVVADLEAKRGDAVRHGTELADERANVALAAHTGDDKAAKRLQEIHQAIAVHGWSWRPSTPRSAQPARKSRWPRPRSLSSCRKLTLSSCALPRAPSSPICGSSTRRSMKW